MGKFSDGLYSAAEKKQKLQNQYDMAEDIAFQNQFSHHNASGTFLKAVGILASIVFLLLAVVGFLALLHTETRTVLFQFFSSIVDTAMTLLNL